MEGETLVYREEPLPLWLRGFAAFLGLGLMTGIPGPFLYHADLTRILPDVLLAVPFVLAPTALGGFFVFLSLCSANELSLDPASRIARHRQFGPLVNRMRHFSFSELTPPEVFMRESSEEAPAPMLRLRLAGRRFEMCGFSDRAGAEHWAGRISRILRG